MHDDGVHAEALQEVQALGRGEVEQAPPREVVGRGEVPGEPLDGPLPVRGREVHGLGVQALHEVAGRRHLRHDAHVRLPSQPAMHGGDRVARRDRDQRQRDREVLEEERQADGDAGERAPQRRQARDARRHERAQAQHREQREALGIAHAVESGQVLEQQRVGTGPQVASMEQDARAQPQQQARDREGDPGPAPGAPVRPEAAPAGADHRQHHRGEAEEMGRVLVGVGDSQPPLVEQVARQHVEIAVDPDGIRDPAREAERAAVRDVGEREQDRERHRGQERGHELDERLPPDAPPPRQDRDRGPDQQRRVETPVHAAQALRGVGGRSAQRRPPARAREEAQQAEQYEREPLVREDLQADQLVHVPGVERVEHAGGERARAFARHLARQQVHAEARRGQRHEAHDVVRQHQVARQPRHGSRLQRRHEEVLGIRERVAIRVEGVAVEQVQRVARQLVQNPADGPDVERRRAVAEEVVRRAQRERPGGDHRQRQVGEPDPEEAQRGSDEGRRCLQAADYSC